LEAALKRFEQGEKITSLLDPDQMKELHGKGAFLEWLNEQNFRLLFAQRIARKSLQALAVLNDFDYFAKDQALVKHRLSERWHLPQ
jgi:selenocysteine-specific translation elongation factor